MSSQLLTSTGLLDVTLLTFPDESQVVRNMEGSFLTGVHWTEDQVITFPQGLPGFDEARRFIILSVPEYEPFHWMECVDGHSVRFAIINPLTFRPDYQPKIRKSDIEPLHLLNVKELLLYVIVTLRNPATESTANLMGPLLINIRERSGRQVIVENEMYSLKERLLTSC